MKNFGTLIIAAFAAEESALGAFSTSEAQISLQLSSVAFCGKSEYMTHPYKGVLSGFKPTYTIYSGLADGTQGLIGYLPSNNSIYISYRGSSNI